MANSVQKIRDKTIDSFLSSSKENQREFMNSIIIDELKEADNSPVLKKFIMMKVFMEARYAAENKSLFNLTAQFRNILALLVPALALKADYGEDPEETSTTGRGVRGLS